MTIATISYGLRYPFSADGYGRHCAAALLIVVARCFSAFVANLDLCFRRTGLSAEGFGEGRHGGAVDFVS